MRYFSPFKVLNEVGTIANKLQLPPEAQLHQVFHVSLIKKCIGDSHSCSSSIPLPLLTIEEGPMLQPKTVVKFISIIQNGQQIVHALDQLENLST